MWSRMNVEITVPHCVNCIHDALHSDQNDPASPHTARRSETITTISDHLTNIITHFPDLAHKLKDRPSGKDHVAVEMTYQRYRTFSIRPSCATF